MLNKSKDILLEHNISITNPRILVLEQLLKVKKPISIDRLLSSLDNQVATSTLYRVLNDCLLYTSPSPRDLSTSRMPSSA